MEIFYHTRTVSQQKTIKFLTSYEIHNIENYKDLLIEPLLYLNYAICTTEYEFVIKISNQAR